MSRLRRVSLPGIAILAGVPVRAFGADPAAGLLAQSVTATAVVVAAILAVAWLLRRLQLTGTMRPGLMRTVATLQVGARERVVIVEVRDKWLVLGVTSAAVSVLESLPKGDPGAPAGEARAADAARGVAFWRERAPDERSHRASPASRTPFGALLALARKRSAHDA